MTQNVDVIVLANKILKKFKFQSVEYLGPSKNFVFLCMDRQGKKYVFKTFHIHENRQEEDLKKAWREIAFHHYAGAKLRLPAMLACEYASGELGVHLLTEFKVMNPLNAKNLTDPRVQEAVDKLFWLHAIRVSSLNPGLRARIEEEDLKNNDWLVSEADFLAENQWMNARTLKTIHAMAKNIRDSPLLAQSKKVLCHGDARIDNAYVDENQKLQFRDFEHANINSPLLDAASFYYSIYRTSLAGVFREAFRTRFLAEYPDTKPRDVDAAFSYFVVHRLMAWIKHNTTFSKKSGEKTRKKNIQDAVALLEDFLGKNA
ncbi:aminoglycoside phosphotransferase family protein [Candidatus Micrarchaeota archaeon]|nr:aminoglycoside phosphotransferase family protein [Candidatus Micrarchaeota archaeon]